MELWSFFFESFRYRRIYNFSRIFPFENCENLNCFPKILYTFENRVLYFLTTKKIFGNHCDIISSRNSLILINLREQNFWEFFKSHSVNYYRSYIHIWESCIVFFKNQKDFWKSLWHHIFSKFINSTFEDRIFENFLRATVNYYRSYNTYIRY